MAKVQFGDVVRETKEKVDRSNNPYEFYVAGDHMDTEDLTIRRKGRFATDDVGPAFIRVFHEGQVLYGSRRTYLKKIAVADFDGVTANTTFVLETKDENVLRQRLLPFIMHTERFTEWSVKRSKGSTNPYVLFSDLADYEFDLPSIEKQDELSELLWSVVEAKEAYNNLIFYIDELVKSQFVEMFGDEKINCCRWPAFLMADVFDITSSRRVLKSEWKKSGIPFLRVRDMVQLADGEPLNNEFFVSEEFYNNLTDADGLTRAGDIMVSATSTIGKTYTIKPGERFYFKDADVLRFRKKLEIDNTFFVYSLKMPTVWEQIEAGLGATTVPHFLISKACKIRQPMPPIGLQEEFAALVRQCDKSKSELKQAIKSLEAIYKKILSEHLG